MCPACAVKMCRVEKLKDFPLPALACALVEIKKILNEFTIKINKNFSRPQKRNPKDCSFKSKERGWENIFQGGKFVSLNLSHCCGVYLALNIIF
jgi:hypothetical protein